MNKIEIMKQVFENYGYDDIVVDTSGHFPYATFRKSLNSYEWCCLNAKYYDGEITIDYVTHKDFVHSYNTTRFEAVFTETEECREIVEVLKELGCFPTE